jgi:hypothetical protein
MILLLQVLLREESQQYLQAELPGLILFQDLRLKIIKITYVISTKQASKTSKSSKLRLQQNSVVVNS